MSTQDSSFPHIPFSITRPEQPFRLLELPPELLELITSRGETGSFKLKAASPTGSSISSAQSKDGFLHLCTDDKVYAVRQVSTSNSVFVLSPTTRHWSSNPDQNPDDVDHEGAGIGLTAISKPTSTLELIPTPFSRAEIIEALRAILPVWDATEHPHDTPPHSTGSKQPLRLLDIRDNLPFPDPQINAALESLFAIHAADRNTLSYNNHDQVLMAFPTAGLLLQAWRMFFDSTTTGSSPLNREEAGLPSLVYESFEFANVMKRVGFEPSTASKNGVDDDDDDDDKNENLEESRDGTFVNCIHAIYSIFKDERNRTLKARETAQFLGELLLLESTSSSSHSSPSKVVGIGIAKETLLNNWLSLLPRHWTHFVTLETLNPAWHVVTHDPNGTEFISWRGPADLAVIAEEVLAKKNNAAATAETAVTATKPAGGAGKKMGKWHEKFAKSRQ